jgi:hypothetical protein
MDALCRYSRGKHKITIVNVYCQFSIPREIFVQKIEDILLGFLYKDIIILGDFNAKSSLWHCRDTDDNGEMFEELIEQHNLVVLNREGQPPTFRGRAGAESNIDVTLSRGDISNCICNWIVHDCATTSAHNVVRFNIEFNRNETDGEDENEGNNTKYNISKINNKKFVEKLKLPQIEHNCNLMELTTNLEDAIWTAIRSSAPKIKQSNKKRTPFWTDSLNKLKRRMKASRKSYRAAGDHILRAIKLQKYRSIKQQFEKELREIK